MGHEGISINKVSWQNLGSLTLADGSTCGIGSIDPLASHLVSRLVQLMQLNRDKDPRRIILVRSHKGDVPDESSLGSQHLSSSENLTRLVTSLPIPIRERTPQNSSDQGYEFDFFNARKYQDNSELVLDLMRLSHAVLHHAQPTGSLLLHSALIEYDGQGFLLAGPGGVGKSTASMRIPAPWRAHSDDVTLLVRDSMGNFWGHPWPTWSDILYGGINSSWDVQYALPLKGIFVIHQANQDRYQVTGEGEAVCLMLELAEQALRIKNRELCDQERRDANLMRYENVTYLTKSVPCFKLGISKTGAFWREIERACHLVNP